MESKKYRKFSNFISFLLGVFAMKDVFDFIETLTNYNNSTMLAKYVLIAQGFFVVGVVLLIAFYFILLENIKKRGVFIRRNEKIMRYFGFSILILGTTSMIICNYWTKESTTSARMLALIGGTLIFVSYIFRIGIEIQEEQDLTI
ncbi:MAG: hypothetical protein H6Q18_278 [Bacteroidetes bacterium]|nr:hypothetical protein [Bacteroidota bacterium]